MNDKNDLLIDKKDQSYKKRCKKKKMLKGGELIDLIFVLKKKSIFILVRKIVSKRLKESSRQ